MEPDVLEHILDGREKPTNLQLALLKNITAHFSEKREIGHGGFATVYKGVLSKGNVAVKRIRSSHTIDEKLFYREVNSLLTINHPNIARFLGYCASTDQRAIKIEGSREHIYAELRERLLCFEYINNGNLQNHVTDELRGLDWSTRYRLIKGICAGLHYLHMEKHIYHMDLKPANILLDNDMVPKITDFGLSRLAEMPPTINLDRCGTLGYCAPEYLSHGKMSVKSDIYSLGTIITELVTGEKSLPDNNKNNVLRRWRHRWRKTGTESQLGYQQVTKCINIGLLCQDIDPCNRPFIWEIVRDINEMEGTNSQISNDIQSMVGQISPYTEDDMLGIEPLELHFTFEPNKEMSCSLELTNEMDSDIAFEVQKMSSLPYCVEPHKGIVPPYSKCSVDITLQPHDKAPRGVNEFIVRSTRVNSGFTIEHITTDMFNKYMGNCVDEVNLDVVFDQLHAEPEDIVPEIIPDSSVFLDVYPLELNFHFEPNKLIACSLDLTNNTYEEVAFRLLKKSDEQPCFLRSLPFFGTVDPGAIYTLVLVMNKHKNLPPERKFDLIMDTSTCCEHYSERQLCEDAEQLGISMHQVTLKVVCDVQGEAIIEVISFMDHINVDNNFHFIGNICNIDANQTKPLIITGHSDGFVNMWNYDTQILMGSIKIPNRAAACSIKFIERKGWFLVGSSDGFIHVYNYEKQMQKINSFRVYNGSVLRHSLAIDPTQTYVLSACNRRIKLCNWENRWSDWKCMQTITYQSRVCALAFNPEDYKSFVSASDDKTIKVWRFDSPNFVVLSGHSMKVNCLDFFLHDGQQYLISGSDDKTAKIWDVGKKECVCTLPHHSEVLSVISHPNRPVLVTGTYDGDVCLWSSTNFRLNRTLNIDGRSLVTSLACLNESGRVVVAHESGLSVIEIGDVEEQGGSSSNNENSVSAAD